MPSVWIGAGVEFAGPSDVGHVEPEWILPKSLRGSRGSDRRSENAGPTLGRRKAALMIDLLRPLHLEGRLGGADDARDLNRNAPVADRRERIVGSSEVSEEDRGLPAD